MKDRQPVLPAFDLPSHLIPVGRYLWGLFVDATGYEYKEVTQALPAISRNGWFPVSSSFDDILKGDIKRVALRYDLPSGLKTFREAEPLACSFYLINSLHETLISSGDLDRYDRYPYQESIQYANDITEINYCQKIFDDIYTRLTGKSPVQEKSHIFWSHDIDYLYSAWKSDLIHSWRKKDFHQMPPILWNRLKSKDRWDNLDEILALEQQYGIQSVFFWLAVQGKKRMGSGAKIDHADYRVKDRYVTDMWKKITDSGSQNGLHKSTFDLSIKEEISQMPHSVNINRNHFLVCQFPDHYYKVENAGLGWDASLGFAEHIGFRNSYGRPFRPFNLKENRPFNFIEIPLHLMDATLTNYMNLDLPEAMDRIIGFVEKHRFNSVIGLLLHNSHFDFSNPSQKDNWHKLYARLQSFPSFHRT